MSHQFFEIGNRYKARRYFYVVTDIDKKQNKIKIRKTDGQELWENNPEILEKIHRTIQLEENTIRFVCHSAECWERDNRLIGFHREAQWGILNVNNKIIYFRLGENEIRGVFKIIEKGKNLNPRFGDFPGISESLIHQCRLELISDDIICNNPMEEKSFTFYPDWSKQRCGGLKTQIFKADRSDLKLILRDPSVVNFED